MYFTMTITDIDQITENRNTHTARNNITKRDAEHKYRRERRNSNTVTNESWGSNVYGILSFVTPATTSS